MTLMELKLKIDAQLAAREEWGNAPVLIEDKELGFMAEVGVFEVQATAGPNDVLSDARVILGAS